MDSTRLGIPALIHEEGLHGLISLGVTSFPVPIALAATFNPDLIRQTFDRIGRETRLTGTHISLSPVLDIARDARWGRFEETYGEDPYLVSRIGVAAVQGFQGTSPGNPQIDSNHVIATMKHFTGYSWAENGNNVSPSLLNKRDLFETHLKPVEAAIKEAHLMGIMPSYNEIEGVPSHGSKYLLDDILRKKLGFKGLTLSDYGGVAELASIHHVAGSDKEAAILGIQAGVDFDLPNASCYRFLPELVREGKVTQAQVDKLVERILEVKFNLGLFENPFGKPVVAEKYIGNAEGGKLVRTVGGESVILLRNTENILPIRLEGIKKVAVVGPNANTCEMGAYYGPPKYTVTLFDALQKKLDGKAEVVFAQGARIMEKKKRNKSLKVNAEDPGKTDLDWYMAMTTENEDRDLIEEAKSKAMAADLIVLCIGGSYSFSREAFLNDGFGDRSSLELTPGQKALYLEMKKLGKKLVVCLIHGGPIADTLLYADASTLLDCHYQGQELGNVVSDILFGEVNPSGKMPYSLPRSSGHIPAYYNHKPSARRGYSFSPIAPAFAFGYGLSYTTFQLSNLKLAKARIGKTESVSVSVDLKNTGSVKGKETVQLYIRDKISSITRPVKELKDFGKIELQPGESRTVALSITPEKLSFYNADFKWIVEPGDFDVLVGTSSNDPKMLSTLLSVE